MKIKKSCESFVNRRELLKYGINCGLSVSVLSAFPNFVKSQNQAQPNKQNVILIIIDTLRADHLGCYGHYRNTSPNIDKFAKDGILFKKAISTSPWTTPSIASIMTSCYPSTLGMYKKTTTIPKRIPLLAEVLKKAGYTTGGTVSNLYVSGRLGFSRGFDVFESEGSSGHDSISSPFVTEKAVSFLKENQKKPFFLFLHYNDPHYDYILHQKYNFYPSYKKGFKRLKELEATLPNKNKLSKNDIRFAVSLYDSEIAFTDEYIGKLLNEIKKLDLYNNSIIVLTADHGEEFFERGHRGHTYIVNKETTHVPLMIKLPNAPSDIVNQYVSLIDIMPTIVQHLGLNPPKQAEGRSIDIMSLKKYTARPIFIETHRTITWGAVIFNERKLIYPKRKKVKNDLSKALKNVHAFAEKPKEIYDLSRDPNEQINLVFKHSNKNIKLEHLFKNWANRSKKRKENIPKKKLFNEEEIKRLKSMGYVGE